MALASYLMGAVGQESRRLRFPASRSLRGLPSRHQPQPWHHPRMLIWLWEGFSSQQVVGPRASVPCWMLPRGHLQFFPYWTSLTRQCQQSVQSEKEIESYSKTETTGFCKSYHRSNIFLLSGGSKSLSSGHAPEEGITLSVSIGGRNSWGPFCRTASWVPGSAICISYISKWSRISLDTSVLCLYFYGVVILLLVP